MKKRLAAVVLVFFLLVLVPRPAFPADDIAGAVNRVDEVMKYVYQHHIGSPSANQLADGAIWGMLDSLGDPYTEYFSPQQLADFTNALDGGFAGIGIELGEGLHYPRVAGVVMDSPAQRAGIQKGDLITHIDGCSIRDIPLAGVASKIRGPVGSEVTLILQRDGRKSFNLTLQRAELSTPTIEWQVIQGNIGYINVHSFGSNTAGEFGRALAELKARGVKGLILDLRNDPGGYLQAAVELAGYFLPPGTVVVSTEEKDGKKEVYRTNGNPSATGIPVVVLVNGLSASSAEVLAGALQDYRAAVLVGERTYGKGVVQAIMPLDNGGALKITIARYYTPKGKSIEGTGLTPDRLVATPQLQLPAACQELQPDDPVRIVFNNNNVLINGEKMAGSFSPLFQQSAVFLPLRFTLEALGYQVTFEQEKQDILATGPAGRIILPVGGKTAWLNNRSFKLERPVVTGGNSAGAYLPVSLLQKIGVQVTERNREIIVQMSRNMAN